MLRWESDRTGSHHRSGAGSIPRRPSFSLLAVPTALEPVSVSTAMRSCAARGLVLLALATLGCREASETREVRAYLSLLQSWSPLEAEAASCVQRILRTQFVDEPEIRRQITDSRPRLAAHLASARAFAAHSESLARVHDRYVKAWDTLLTGYDEIERGFDTGDYRDLARGRQSIEKWREEIVGVAADVRTLAARLGIDLPGQTKPG